MSMAFQPIDLTCEYSTKYWVSLENLLSSISHMFFNNELTPFTVLTPILTIFPTLSERQPCCFLHISNAWFFWGAVTFELSMCSLKYVLTIKLFAQSQREYRPLLGQRWAAACPLLLAFFSPPIVIIFTSTFCVLNSFASAIFQVVDIHLGRFNFIWDSQLETYF